MEGRERKFAQRPTGHRPAWRAPRAAVPLVLMLMLVACGGAADESSDNDETAANAAEPTTVSSTGSAADPAEGCPNPGLESAVQMFDIATAQFSNPAEIDATYLPMSPGTQHTYEGQALDGNDKIARKVIITVTDLTKVVGGVESTVIWEQDFNGDQLVESELGFFAQDDEGNVWHIGEYYELWEDGEYVGGRIWAAGDPPCALGGIQMWAQPEVGLTTYSQGFAPEPFFWADRATVDEITDEHCVPVDCYTDVLVTAESDEADPDAEQLKFYAPDIGNIAVGWRGNDPEQEELELVERTRLDAAAMAQVRDEARAMERRGGMFGRTSAAQRRMPAK